MCHISKMMFIFQFACCFAAQRQACVTAGVKRIHYRSVQATSVYKRNLGVFLFAINYLIKTIKVVQVLHSESHKAPCLCVWMSNLRLVRHNNFFLCLPLEVNTQHLQSSLQCKRITLKMCILICKKINSVGPFSMHYSNWRQSCTSSLSSAAWHI